MVDPLTAKLGVSRSVLAPVDSWHWPLHGLRHPPEGDTSGWYCWTGDLTADPDFFVPLHATHLTALVPAVVPCLLGAPGTRFMLGPESVEIWDDPSLLEL